MRLGGGSYPAEYTLEAERLTALREELRGAARIQPTVHIDGMAEGWAKGNPARRRQLLTVMFDRLMVKDGEIVNYVPRADRVTEVVGLVERAIPGGVVHDVPTEHAWRAKGRPRKNTCKSGKGGIRLRSRPQFESRTARRPPTHHAIQSVSSC